MPTNPTDSRFATVNVDGLESISNCNVRLIELTQKINESYLKIAEIKDSGEISNVEYSLLQGDIATLRLTRELVVDRKHELVRQDQYQKRHVRLDTRARQDAALLAELKALEPELVRRALVMATEKNPDLFAA